MTDSKETKVLWLWQSNLHPWSKTEEEEWSPYSDEEIQLLETTYKQEKLMVELEKYIIDLHVWTQISKQNPCKSRPIVRHVVQQNQQYLRRQRFCVAEVPSFIEYHSIGQLHFSFEWWRNNACSYTAQVEKAAEGILVEGRKLGQIRQASIIAKALIDVKDKGWLEIAKCCIYQYTRETFLYKLINTTLREMDWSKVDTLGPFCHLLSTADSASPLVNTCRYKGLVFRGMQLTRAQIASYRDAIGQGLKTWLNFSSTSCNRTAAERFGNTLLIIDLQSDYHGLHIASISYYPTEDEVLLRASQKFWVHDVQYDKTSRKHHIYIVIDDVCS